MIIEHKRNFKYYVNQDAFDFLVAWVFKNKPLVDGLTLSNSYYSEKSVIYMQMPSNTVSDFTPHCYFDVKSQYVKAMFKINVLQNGEKYKGLKFKLAPKEKNYKLKGEFDTYCDLLMPSQLSPTNTLRIQSASLLYTAINAFMFYGNITDDNHLKAVKQNDHIIFKIYDDKLYAIPTDKNSIHKSPEGIFSVRGHFRKYKSGKVVWINEYLKGLNK